MRELDGEMEDAFRALGNALSLSLAVSLCKSAVCYIAVGRVLGVVGFRVWVGRLSSCNGIASAGCSDVTRQCFRVDWPHRQLIMTNCSDHSPLLETSLGPAILNEFVNDARRNARKAEIGVCERRGEEGRKGTKQALRDKSRLI